MAFQVTDYHDLMRLLYQHPEWQQELRQLLLTKDILELPVVVRELAEAQRRTEQRVEELAQAQQRTEQRLEMLIESHQTLEQQVRRLTDRVGHLDGRMLEIGYRDRVAAYFGRLLRKVRIVPSDEMVDRVESVLNEEQIEALMALDVVVQGNLRRALEPLAEGTPVWIAIEISATIADEDIERAAARADLLRKAGMTVLPLVAGERISERVFDLARQAGVMVQLDGKFQNLEHALMRLKE
ncbi:MAG: hypothetical protein N2117_00865 [Anaerolineales bacterium]|nr:hypothetical protein [Anaerolineales bacterium]